MVDDRFVDWVELASLAVLVFGKRFAKWVGVDTERIVVEFGSSFGEIFSAIHDVALVVGHDHPLKLEIEQWIIDGDDQLALMDQGQIVEEEILWRIV